MDLLQNKLAGMNMDLDHIWDETADLIITAHNSIIAGIERQINLERYRTVDLHQFDLRPFTHEACINAVDLCMARNNTIRAVSCHHHCDMKTIHNELPGKGYIICCPRHQYELEGNLRIRFTETRIYPGDFDGLRGGYLNLIEWRRGYLNYVEDVGTGG